MPPRATPQVPQVRKTGARSKRSRRAAVAVGIAASVVLLSVLLPERVGGPPTAAASLRALASRARDQERTTIPAGSYLYSRLSQRALGSGSGLAAPHWSFIVRSIRRSWMAADGSGRFVTTYDVPEFLSDEDEAAWRDAGSTPLVADGPQVEHFEPGMFPTLDLSRLSSEPEALTQQLASGQVGDAPTGGAETLDLIAGLLSEQTASPQVRGALFEVAASIPGVEAVGEIDDPAGRSGVGVRLASAEGATTLIFHPATSMLLAQVDERPIDGSQQVTWRSFGPSVIVGSFASKG